MFIAGNENKNLPEELMKELNKLRGLLEDAIGDHVGVYGECPEDCWCCWLGALHDLF